MNIKCKVVKNELSVDMHVSRYAKIVEELRKEVSSNSYLSKNQLVQIILRASCKISGSYIIVYSSSQIPLTPGNNLSVDLTRSCGMPLQREQCLGIANCQSICNGRN